MKMHGALFAMLVLSVFSAAPGAAVDDTVDLDSLRGKVIYLDFWASWCEPCRQSFPWMNQLQSELADSGLIVIAVNVDTERAAAEQFLRSHPAGFRIAYDPQGKLPEKFGVRGMPSSFLIDRAGRIQFKHQGFFLKDRDSLAQQVRAAVLAH